MKGDLKIDTAGPGDTKAKLVAADSSGSLAGSVDGHAHGGGDLVGAFAGNFNPATDFASGSIGTGGSGAVLSNPSPCTKATSKP